MKVTKHCSQENLERMRQGHFRIGTHGDYSKGQSTGLLSDTKEGTGRTNFLATNAIINGNFGGSIIRNVIAFNATTPLAINEAVDFNIFCASFGGYKLERHQKIRDGSDVYQPNPECTEYAVLSAPILREALEAATTAFYGTRTRWIMKPVSYNGRVDNIKVKDRHFYSTPHRRSEIAFRKPPEFALEEEFRFVMLPSDNIERVEPILTKDLSQEIQTKFAASIVLTSGATD